MTIQPMFDPTGTHTKALALTIAIRKIYRKKLNNILTIINQNKVSVEKMIRLEATIGINAVDIIMKSFDSINSEIKPYIFSYLLYSWDKGNKDANKNLGRTTAPNMSVFKLMQDNALGYITKFTEEQKQKTRNLLTDGITQGDSITSISKEIKKAFGTSSYRSEMIARSEMVRTYNVGTRESMKSAGVNKYLWQSALRENTGKVDRALHGRIFDINAKGTMVVEGKTISKSPMPVTDTHPNCMCKIIPQVEIPN